MKNKKRKYFIFKTNSKDVGSRNRRVQTHGVEQSEACLTCVQVGQVWVLNIGVMLFQVVAELHGRVGAEGALWTVVHLHALVFPRVQNVLADVLRTVGSEGDGDGNWRVFSLE